MEIQQHQIEISRTAHYYTLGELGEHTKHVWIVIHGYGQLAKFFIKKFEPLVDKESVVVAPEGVSKYYLESGSKRVGASWMTKENREDEIKDQIAYLDQLLEEILKISGNVDINLLGFSQGVATAYRWYAMGKVAPSRIVFWAGRLPNEKIDVVRTKFAASLIYGSNDEFRHLIDWEEQKQILENSFAEHQIEVFEGKHEITSELVERYL